jgi:hypothetical protein
VPIRPAVPGRHYKPATVRFYFDADVLGRAHQIAGLRPDATYPGDPGGVVMKRLRPPGPVTSTAVKDRVWIPQITALGWLIITRDRRIQDHPSEIAAVRDSGARMVALSGKDARGTFDQLEVFMPSGGRSRPASRSRDPSSTPPRDQLPGSRSGWLTVTAEQDMRARCDLPQAPPAPSECGSGASRPHIARSRDHAPTTSLMLGPEVPGNC